MENWYVYYALPDAQRAAVLQSVRAMQSALAAASGVATRLELRVGGEAPTVMEVYERIANPEHFGAALQAAVAAAGLAPELSAARRIERFMPV